ncbi:Plasmodium vivax Vir protein, putative [Plasmodium ovale]|uniref:Plasmodium vivax Vir protein, putative n=1 Tax=Plasmodium ovale TaxID=36330 RepID=A0A1C3KIZ1_PLAOA|nr:Plasmodium vivax Vir protein, putative [Plasmodium ovale]
MGTEDNEYFGEFKKGVDDKPEEEEEDLDDQFLAGENYYSSINSFHVYEEEFSTVDGETSNIQKYQKLCSTFSDVFYSNNYPIDSCFKIAKYLHHIKLKKDQNNDDRCKCLNYLLNTSEEFNTSLGYEAKKLFRAYNKLSNKIDTCNLRIEYIENEEVLGKIKKLHDLHKTMVKLENSISSKQEDIQKNAEEFAQYYLNTKNDCQGTEMDGYCTELKVIEQYIYRSTQLKKYTKASEILRKLIPNDGTSIIVSCIMSLGITFILYILYKFTPLGSLANTQIQKKIKMWNNIPENESQLHIPGHDQLNMENSKFNIKYHSA